MMTLSTKCKIMSKVKKIDMYSETKTIVDISLAALYIRLFSICKMLKKKPQFYIISLYQYSHFYPVS